MPKLLILTIGLLFLASISFAQAPIVNLTFDNCEATNTGPLSPDGEVSGSPECVCGVFDNAFRFSGGEDAIAIKDSAAFRLLTFSISFYFQPEKGGENFIVLSHQEECNSLVGLSVLYRAASNSLEVEFTRDLGRRVVMTANLPDNKCWYQIIIERSGGRHSVFVDGEKVVEENAGGLIEFANNAPIVIGSGPCVPAFQLGMRGSVDEFRIYDRILTNAEKFQLRRDVQTILTPDTVVLVGSDVGIRVSEDCTNSYFWTPASGVANPAEGNTTISPMESMTWFLEFSEFNCRVRDSISIIVVDPDDVGCEDLVLPNAFTPNSDGLNDRFFISNPFLIEELLSFEIFDRSGATMFRTINPNDSWDGSFRGEAVNPGVYLYKVEYRCDGNTFLKSGQVAVIR